MKFGQQFEYHKIPEWYSEYLDYNRFKKLIKTFKGKVKCKFSYHIIIKRESSRSSEACTS